MPFFGPVRSFKRLLNVFKNGRFTAFPVPVVWVYTVPTCRACVTP